MNKKLDLGTGGGVIHFDIKTQKNVLREFLAFKRLTNMSTKRFSYIHDLICYTQTSSVKEYVFKDCCDDFKHFDIIEALEIKKASHLSELLYNRQDLNESIDSLSPQDAKYYELLWALLKPSDTILLLNIETINFSPIVNERLKRVLERETRLKNRTVLVYGKIPVQWKALVSHKVTMDQSKKFQLQPVEQNINDKQSQKPREMVKFSA